MRVCSYQKRKEGTSDPYPAGIWRIPSNRLLGQHLKRTMKASCEIRRIELIIFEETFMQILAIVQEYNFSPSILEMNEDQMRNIASCSDTNCQNFN